MLLGVCMRCDALGWNRVDHLEWLHYDLDKNKMRFVYWFINLDMLQIQWQWIRWTVIVVDSDADLFCITADTGWTSDLTNAHDDCYKALGLFSFSSELLVSQAMSEFRMTRFLSDKLLTFFFFSYPSQIPVLHLSSVEVFFSSSFFPPADEICSVCVCVCTCALLLSFLLTY